jgi:hypothetical protein
MVFREILAMLLCIILICIVCVFKNINWPKNICIYVHKRRLIQKYRSNILNTCIYM